MTAFDFVQSCVGSICSRQRSCIESLISMQMPYNEIRKFVAICIKNNNHMRKVAFMETLLSSMDT